MNFDPVFPAFCLSCAYWCMYHWHVPFHLVCVLCPSKLSCLLFQYNRGCLQLGTEVCSAMMFEEKLSNPNIFRCYCASVRVDSGGFTTS